MSNINKYFFEKKSIRFKNVWILKIRRLFFRSIDYCTARKILWTRVFRIQSSNGIEFPARFSSNNQKKSKTASTLDKTEIKHHWNDFPYASGIFAQSFPNENPFRHAVRDHQLYFGHVSRAGLFPSVGWKNIFPLSRRQHRLFVRVSENL